MDGGGGIEGGGGLSRSSGGRGGMGGGTSSSNDAPRLRVKLGYLRSILASSSSSSSDSPRNRKHRQLAGVHVGKSPKGGKNTSEDILGCVCVVNSIQF